MEKCVFGELLDVREGDGVLLGFIETYFYLSRYDNQICDEELECLQITSAKKKLKQI